MTHRHMITYRGAFPLDTWNRLIIWLSNNNIPYRTQSNISPTRDDAGLNKWYERIIFTHDKYIPYRTNRKRISLKEYSELLTK